MPSEQQATPVSVPATSGFKDPHVFPFLVKGFRQPTTLKYESRRSITEAHQTADRFNAEGLDAYIFECREVGQKSANAG